MCEPREGLTRDRRQISLPARSLVSCRCSTGLSEQTKDRRARDKVPPPFLPPLGVSRRSLQAHSSCALSDRPVPCNNARLDGSPEWPSPGRQPAKRTPQLMEIESLLITPAFSLGAHERQGPAGR